MKKFLILWWMPGYGDMTVTHKYTHLAESEEAAEAWLKKRFDELFVQCERVYQIYEVPSFTSEKSYDTRKVAA